MDLFERILIANRGEVAARVARTCRRLGIETVGIHVEQDADALHVQACDEAVCVGNSAAAYLDSAALAKAALDAKVHAVHPGYGLLADEPGFAAAVEEAGLIFVGPGAERFEAARSRITVRKVAEDCGVRVLPATDEPILDPNAALAAVDALGYPVVVKPVRGVGEPLSLPVCEDVAALSEALAALEPLADHGGALLERHIDRARHVEVQLIVDSEEAVVLSDREVSLRADNGRLVAESPAPALDQLHHGEALRGALFEASSEIAMKLGCKGLMSCRYLIDADGTYFFVGFTPSLQVEHATSEMRAGIDLVEMQLRLAAGESMPSEVQHVEPTGSALQARLVAATDPETGRPFESRVDMARWPPSPQGKVRIESALRVGARVAPEHDPLVATVTTFAPNRHDALLMLDRVLAEIHVGPVVTNIRLLRKALNDQSFFAGQYDESFLDRLRAAP